MTESGSPKLKAPKHLKPATRKWWLSVVGSWELDEHHVRLLTLASEAWDRATQAREQLTRDGLTVETRDGGLKRHPCCAIEAESRLAFVRIVRELDLDVEGPPSEARRPPMLRAFRGGTGAA